MRRDGAMHDQAVCSWKCQLEVLVDGNALAPWSHSKEVATPKQTEEGGSSRYDGHGCSRSCNILSPTQD